MNIEQCSLGGVVVCPPGGGGGRSALFLRNTPPPISHTIPCSMLLYKYMVQEILSVSCLHPACKSVQSRFPACYSAHLKNRCRKPSYTLYQSSAPLQFYSQDCHVLHIRLGCPASSRDSPVSVVPAQGSQTPATAFYVVLEIRTQVLMPALYRRFYPWSHLLSHSRSVFRNTGQRSR